MIPAVAASAAAAPVVVESVVEQPFVEVVEPSASDASSGLVAAAVAGLVDVGVVVVAEYWC